MADEPVKEARQKLAATLLAILRKNKTKVHHGLLSALNEILEAKRLQNSDSCPGDVIEEAPEAPPPVIPETVPDQSAGSEEVKPQPEPETEIKKPETTGGMITMGKNPEELTNNNEASGNVSASGTRPSGSSRPAISTRPSTTSRPSTSTRPSISTRPSTRPRPSTGSSQDEEFDLPAEELTGLLAQESLLPIKGIDRTRQQCLRQLGIQTPADLLRKARTVAQRKELVPKLIALEKEKDPDAPAEGFSEYRYERYLASWVRQTDLYRAKGMDEDTAYLLVQLGVRHLEDLAKLDIDKVYPMLLGLHQAQPQYDVISREQLKELIVSAGDKAGENPEAQEKLQKLLMESLRNTASNVPADINDAYVKQLLTDLSGHLMDISVKDILGPRSNIECDDPAPTYLFTEENDVPNVMDALNIPTVVNISKIVSGIEVLKNMPMELNPPRFIRGRVFIVRAGQTLPASEKDRRGYALYDALVELDGTATSNTDSTENAEKPSAYTDGDGWFTIELPTGTNLCQKLTLTVSQGSCKQKFSISADTLLDSCPERRIINDMLQLDKLYEDYLHDDELYQTLKWLQNRIEKGEEVSEEDQTFYNSYKDDMESLYKEIELAEDRIRELEDSITSSDSTTNDMSRILRNLTEKTDIVADLSEAPFIVNENIFKGLRTDQPKVMPSVKLMEQDDKPVYLPTDTAPSKIYQYSMLQRLVEPEIKRGSSSTSREAIADALDVSAFRKKLATDHSELRYMSSLGIGYNLNMHQAWVPDGFALGNLLYSLVLAPGEEQRLIVRENKQSYTLMDEASGTDRVGESYNLSQQDNTDAMFQNALEQMMSGNSAYSVSSSSWSIGGSGSYGGGGFGVGLSGGYGSSSSKGSASASQRNTHSEASSAAQSFQHGIKMASEKLSQAKRLSISMATSAVEESAATRIIANHNHSHTMTVQYWEVMRRYRLETCVDSVDLVLFVPVKPICFAPPADCEMPTADPILTYCTSPSCGECAEARDKNRGEHTYKPESNTKFVNRYKAVFDNADVLESALPWQYRAGLNVIRKYSTMTGWKIEELPRDTTVLTMTITGHFLSCDHLNPVLVLKNGKGSVRGQMNMTKLRLRNTLETSEAVYDAIRTIRSGSDDAIKKVVDTDNVVKTHRCSFTLPQGATMADISHVRLNYSCEPLSYTLYKHFSQSAADGDYASSNYGEMWDKMWDLAKDSNNSANDVKMIEYYRSTLPEAWREPNITVSPGKISSLGSVYINADGFSDGKIHFTAILSSQKLSASTTVELRMPSNVLTRADLQKAEETLQHVMNNTMRYSQAVWNSLTLNERAMLLDQYTIHMDNWMGEKDEKMQTNIPLLNCINVHKLLGFYGNCMLFPFTYPEALAKQIGRTAAELQDTLFRHHANNFRVPVTTISLPTDGMIGEAVLGATNVSEEIDLTRFWNWSDSPIDKMTLTADALKGTDYLSGKDTMSLTGLNLSGASAPDSVSIPDLVNALISRQLPEFDNLTGQQYLKDLVNGAANSADAARSSALSTSSEALKTAISHVEKMKTAENDLIKTYVSNGRDADGTLNKEALAGKKPGAGAGGSGAAGSAAGGTAGGAGAGGAGGTGSAGGSAGTGGAKPTGGSSGKTADILINYYNGASGVTTVEQKPSSVDKKNGSSSTVVNSKPAASDNDISQEDLDKLVDAALNGMPGSPAGDISQEALDKLVELGQAASKDAMKNTHRAKEGA